MMCTDFLIRSKRVLLPDGERPAAVRVCNGIITAIEPYTPPEAQDIPAISEPLATPAGAAGRVVDLGERVLMPGLVDTHVHLNEPGRAEWEGFATGSAAARAGGITTLIDMPLNSSPVTTSAETLELKRQAAAKQLSVDVGFYGGLIPGSEHRIHEMLDAGVRGIKAFLCHSGLDEFPNATEKELRTAMPVLAQRSAVLLVHCELLPASVGDSNSQAGLDSGSDSGDDSEVDSGVDSDSSSDFDSGCGSDSSSNSGGSSSSSSNSGGGDEVADPRRYADYLATRPASFERDAIALMIRLCRDTGCRTHIVHLADAGCLPMLEQAKAEGLPITVETCPHYLAFAAEQIPDGFTLAKCAPPIRDEANRRALWDGLQRGVIDMVVSDHSPAPPELKSLDDGRFDRAWGGVSSLQLGLHVMWKMAHDAGVSLHTVTRWMGQRPAELVDVPFGIAVGQPAHLVVFDPDAVWVPFPEDLLHRHKLTPYLGMAMRGRVERTYVHGQADAGALAGRLL